MVTRSVSSSKAPPSLRKGSSTSDEIPPLDLVLPDRGLRDRLLVERGGAGGAGRREVPEGGAVRSGRARVGELARRAEWTDPPRGGAREDPHRPFVRLRLQPRLLRGYVGPLRADP